MAITRIGTGQSIAGNNGNTTTMTFNGTGGIPLADDYAIIYGGNGTVTGSAAFGPSTAGYTLINGSNASGTSFGVWYKKMGPTPDASVAMFGTGLAADSSAYATLILRGVDLTTPLDCASAYALVIDGPGPITPVTAGCMAVIAGAISDNTAPSAAPSGYTLGKTAGGLDTNKIGIASATQLLAAAGSFNSGAWTWTQVTPKKGVLIAFRPAGAGGGSIARPSPRPKRNYLMAADRAARW